MHKSFICLALLLPIVLGDLVLVQDAASATILAPTVQVFTSGSGTYTLPTKPRKPLYIKGKMVRGGGGGSGSGSGGEVSGFFPPPQAQSGTISTFGR